MTHMLRILSYPVYIIYIYTFICVYRESGRGENTNPRKFENYIKSCHCQIPQTIIPNNSQKISANQSKGHCLISAIQPNPSNDKFHLKC